MDVPWNSGDLPSKIRGYPLQCPLEIRGPLEIRWRPLQNQGMSPGNWGTSPAKSGDVPWKSGDVPCKIRGCPLECPLEIRGRPLQNFRFRDFRFKIRFKTLWIDSDQKIFFDQNFLTLPFFHYFWTKNHVFWRLWDHKIFFRIKFFLPSF